MEQQINFIRTQIEPLGNKYTVRVDRDIDEPSSFQEELATIRQATEGDVVHILINSGGGYLSTAKAFLSAIAQTNAHVICEIEGDACSAATLIFLGADEFRVSDDAAMMIHTASYGYYGKENNVRQYVEYQAMATEKLLRKYYRHFMTEEEITKTIDGADYWFDADEIIRRLEVRQDLFEKEFSLREETTEYLVPKEKLEFLDKETLIKFITGELSDEELDTILGSEDQPSKDCVEFYNKDGLVKILLVSKDGSVLDDDGEVFTSEDSEMFLGVDADFDYFKSIAVLLNVKYPHNISQEKLCLKLNAKVKEIVDKLNQD